MQSEISQDTIAQNISHFKTELANAPALQVVRQHILSGGCFALAENDYFDLRSEVAEHYELHTNEVLVVGSAKQGFSIAPHKRYRHFGENSDIDVVIVSPILFDRIWKAAFDYWKNGSYWPHQKEFTNYLFQGWIRPDKLPPSKVFPIGQDWWEFFRELTQSKRFSYYKIAGALYKSWYFLENYQLNCVNDCQQQIIGIQ